MVRPEPDAAWSRPRAVYPLQSGPGAGLAAPGILLRAILAPALHLGPELRVPQPMRLENASMPQ